MPALPTRRDLRLASGLVLFTYVSVHLLTHASGLWSLDAAETGLAVAVRVWHSLPGTLVLYGAAATHIGLALWSIYERRTLRMPPLDLVRILLGLGTPLLLIGHVVATRYASDAYGLSPVYSRIVYNLFVSDNEGRQLALLVPGWLHGCLGVWYAFKRRDAVMRLKLPLFAFALLVPVLAGLGFVSMGREIEDLARDPDWIASHAEVAPDAARVGLARVRDGILFAWLALIGMVFLAREIRDRVERGMDRVVTIAYPGRRVSVPRGWSVLEASRGHGIAHTSVCGGRARCSTCRVRVVAGLDTCAPPDDDERRTLARIGAPGDVRLACRLRPTGDVTVVPLVAPEAVARDVEQARERRVAILAATIVERVAAARAPLPHDRLYVMNRTAEAIGEAVLEAGGEVVEVTGEGVLATFGDGEAALAARARHRAALRRARDEARRGDRRRARRARRRACRARGERRDRVPRHPHARDRRPRRRRRAPAARARARRGPALRVHRRRAQQRRGRVVRRRRARYGANGLTPASRNRNAKVSARSA
jgi:adenylate cyclase